MNSQMYSAFLCCSQRVKMRYSPICACAQRSPLELGIQNFSLLFVFLKSSTEYFWSYISFLSREVIKKNNPVTKLAIKMLKCKQNYCSRTDWTAAHSGFGMPSNDNYARVYFRKSLKMQNLYNVPMKSPLLLWGE